jgi:hypothetical protein
VKILKTLNVDLYELRSGNGGEGQTGKNIANINSLP